MKGSAARRNFDPTQNGIAAYRFLLTSAHLQCEESVGDDNLYAAHVNRLRKIAQPSIRRQFPAWKRLRDGHADEETGDWVPGFWLDERGKPIEPGKPIPKEAYVGMEGAVHEILHLDGLYWIKPKRSNKMLDKYREKMGAVEDLDEQEEEEDVEP